MAKKAKYDGDSIVALDFPVNVRTRPGMYFGGTTSDGMHHIFKEIFDNSLDEAVAGYCKKITITREEDGFISVIDSGRGIPTSINKAKGVSGLELVFTILHAGGKFSNDQKNSGYKVSSGLHGVGASVTNAVSESLQVWVKRDKKMWTQEYERGIKLSEVKKTKSCPVEFPGDSGTYVRFKPDKQIFKHIEIEWEYDRIIRRCREVAFLVPGLEIEIKGWEDQEENPDISFKYDNGLMDYVDY
ncbi:MAG: DNA topoisomerase IV subunit B, partial [Dehalococcoidia bacterium]